MPTSRTAIDVKHACTMPGPIPFPATPQAIRGGKAGATTNQGTADDVLAAFATVSRRINDLARELKCLGYFDDENDRPRAA